MSLKKYGDFASIRTQNLSWLDTSGSPPIASSLLTVGLLPRLRDRASWTVDASLNTLTLGSSGVLSCSGDLLLVNGSPVETSSKGPAGQMGPTGSAGGVGWIGLSEAGPQGEMGPTGAAGGTGSTGATGRSGPQGLPGATGAGLDGPAGPIGSTGMAGPNGAVNSPESNTIISSFPPGSFSCFIPPLFGTFVGDLLFLATLSFNGPIIITGGQPRVIISTTYDSIVYHLRSTTFVAYTMNFMSISFGFFCTDGVIIRTDLVDCNVLSPAPFTPRQSIIDYTYLPL